MECNKEDALKAKRMAEKKFEEKDLVGAKRFALKAQNLYPKIDGLRQLIATLDVYISAEEMRNGERDWYRVLGVDPLADEATLRNQFKKLAADIHPDRNKSVGAVGAFKILSEAYGLLSDHDKRKGYNLARERTCKFENILGRQSSVPDGQNGVPNLLNRKVSNETDYGGTGQNGVPNLSNINVSNERDRKGKGKIGVLNISNENVSNERDCKGKGKIGVPDLSNENGSAERDCKGANYIQQLSVSGSSSPIKPTFWTICNGCTVHYKYHRKYLRRNLLCANCSRRFLALEVPPPPTDRNRSAEPLASPLQKHKAGESTINNSSSARETIPTSTTSIVEWVRFSGLDSSQKTFQVGLFSDMKKKVVSAESMKAPTSTTSMGRARFSGRNSYQKTSRAGLFSAVNLIVNKEVSVERMRAPTSATSMGLATFSGLDSSPKTFQAGLFSEEWGNREISTASMRTPTYTTGTERARFAGLNSRLKNFHPTERMRVPTSTTSMRLARFSGFDSSQRTFRAGIFSDVKVREERDVSAEGMRAPTSVNDCWRWKRRFKEGALDVPMVPRTGTLVLKKVVSGVTLRSVVTGDEHKKRGRMINRIGIGGVAVKTALGSQEGGTGTAATTWTERVGTGKLSFTKELPHEEMRKMLMEKAKKEIGGKLSEWKIAVVSEIPYKSKEMSEKQRGKKEAAKPGVKESTGKIAVRKFASNLTLNIPDPVSMTIAEPHFYDFNENRTTSAFNCNQVWAAYDPEDGMPRLYALIHNLMADEPFRVSISWLNSKSTDEFSPLSWTVSGIPRACGEFRVGMHGDYDSLVSFSHQVKWTYVAREVVQIYPSKGDVWAIMYRRSPNWNEHRPKEVIRKYYMVEVIRDYNEERGVTVIPLAKAVGYKTVFCRHWDSKEVEVIPREEMFRFSHQVPSHLLTGNEHPDDPSKWFHLDPAAIPSELLQETNGARKQEKVKTAAKPLEQDPIKSSKRHKVVAEKNGKENGGNVVVYNRRGIGKAKMI
ncbi:hypothetical protein TIFTF001_025734 [Ficus carica]|uniref:J domain-containing protein n=1 Tax=Ficus carica TaxID=3494 RepID=A0AA88DKM0_FICCA|nr:hypothetical protein TIFTF001_025734 [Ficus carica]